MNGVRDAIWFRGRHEARHAVLAVFLGRKVKHIRPCNPDEDCTARTQLWPDKGISGQPYMNWNYEIKALGTKHLRIQRHLMIRLAGMVGRFSNEGDELFADDERDVVGVLSVICANDAIRSSYRKYLEECVREILGRPAVVQAVEEVGTQIEKFLRINTILDGKELLSMMHELLFR